MADLGTLLFGTFDATNSTDTSIVGTDPVLEAIASTDDADYVRDVTNSTHTGVAFFALGDTPADFGTMDTLSVQLRYALQSGTQVNTWSSLTAQVLQSDRSTALTDERTIASSITTTTPTNSGALAFTGVQAGSKTLWDGAVVAVRFSVTRVKGGDSLEERVFAAEVTGTYTADAGGPDPITASDTPTVSLTETQESFVSSELTDTPSVSIGEAAAILAGLDVTDSPTVGVSDVSDLLVSVEASDTSTVSVTESADLIVGVSTTDTPTVSVTEAQDSLLTSSVSDSPTVGVTETQDSFLTSDTVDTLTVGLTDAVLVAVLLELADTLTVGATGQITGFEALLDIVDFLNVGLDETWVVVPTDVATPAHPPRTTVILHNRGISKALIATPAKTRVVLDSGKGKASLDSTGVSTAEGE